MTVRRLILYGTRSSSLSVYSGQDKEEVIGVTSFGITDARRLRFRRVVRRNFALIVLGFNVLALEMLNFVTDIGLAPMSGSIMGHPFVIANTYCLILCTLFFGGMKLHSRYLVVHRIEIRGNQILLYKQLRTIKISVADLERVLVRRVQGEKVAQLWLALETNKLWQLVAVSSQLDRDEIWNLLKPRLCAQTKVWERYPLIEMYRPDTFGAAVAFGISAGSFALGEDTAALIFLALSLCLIFVSYFASKRSDHA